MFRCSINQRRREIGSAIKEIGIYYSCMFCISTRLAEMFFSLCYRYSDAANLLIKLLSAGVSEQLVLIQTIRRCICTNVQYCCEFSVGTNVTCSIWHFARTQLTVDTVMVSSACSWPIG
jgi:hypothetical protein